MLLMATYFQRFLDFASLRLSDKMDEIENDEQFV